MSMLKEHIIAHVIEHKASIKLGLGSMLSISVGFVEQFEVWLRLVGLILGVLVGIMTLYRMYLDVKVKNKQLKSIKKDDNSDS